SRLRRLAFRYFLLYRGLRGGTTRNRARHNLSSANLRTTRDLNTRHLNWWVNLYSQRRESASKSGGKPVVKKFVDRISCQLVYRMVNLQLARTNTISKLGVGRRRLHHRASCRGHCWADCWAKQGWFSRDQALCVATDSLAERIY